MRLSSLISRALGRPDPARPDGPPAPARVLFLDDDPLRADVFLADCPHAVWVQTAADCIEKFAEPWDEIHLDHDLGGQQFVDHNRDDCGMEVVRWICLEPRPHLRNSRFTVHSHNAGAATLMAMQLMANGFHVDVRPFGAPPTPPATEPESHLPAPALTLAGVVWAIRSLFRKPANDGYSYDEYMRDSNNAPLERLDLSWKLPPKRPEPQPGSGRPEPPVTG